MKNIVKHLVLFTISALTLLGCDLFMAQNSKGDSSTIKVSILSESSFQRTIEADSNPEISGYDIYGSVDGGEELNLAHFTTLGSNSVLNLSSGVWDFTLYALNSEGDQFLKGEVSNILLADLPVSLTFTLNPLSQGAGTLKVNVTWPDSVDVASVLPVIDGVNGDVISTTGLNNITYTYSAERGGYLLFLNFRNSDDVIIATIPEYIKLLPNMVSSADIELTESDFNSAPNIPENINTAVSPSSSQSTGSVLLSWDDNSTNETGFEVSCSDDSGATWTTLTDSLTATTIEYIDSTPLRGSLREYRVRALNSFGKSDWSSTVSFSVPWLVTFNSAEGSVIDNQEIVDGSSVVEPEDPSRSGDEFNGWYSEDTFSTLWDFTSAVTSNTTLYAGWTTVIEFKGNFGNAPEGTTAGSMTTLYPTEGELVTIPDSLFTRDGYDFAGWSTKELGVIEYSATDEITVGTTGLTLYARWNRTDAMTASLGTSTTTDLNYELNGDGTGAIITRYNKTTNAVVIPDIVDGYPVVGIKDVTSYSSGAFYSKKTYVYTVYIPESMESIGGYAFYNSNLTSVDMSQCRVVESIKYRSFGSCSNLTSVEFPDSVKELSPSAFLSCTSMTSVLFNEGLTTIGSEAFQSCTSLTTITFPDTLLTIGDSAFSSCSNLVSINFNEGLKSIGNNSFYNCPLTVLNFPNSLETIGTSAFYNYYNSNITTINFGEGLKTIGGNAFSARYSNTKVTELSLPDSLESIGDSAFSGFSKVTSINFGEGLKSTGNSSFSSNSSLTEITFPDSLISIGSSAFSSCTSLRSIELNEGLKTIGDSAFYNNDALVEVVIPDSVTTIGSSVFSSCDGLNRVILGSGITSIGTSLFTSCDYLQEIVINSDITSIPNQFTQNCYRLTTINLPDSITTIGESAFRECNSLGFVDLPDSLISIGDYAFNESIGLISIEFNNSLTTIGRNAFNGCSNLEEANLPDSLTTIGIYAFQNCSSLETLSTGNGLTEIPTYAFQNCTSLKTVELSSNLTTVGMYAFDEDRALERVEFGDRTTTISDYAFQNCGNLSDLVLPESIETIGKYAFNNCDSIIELEFPDSLTTIGQYVFNDCDGIETLTLNNKLLNIPAFAFNSCSNLNTINFAEGLNSISNHAFSSCSDITTLDFPETLTSIGESAFRVNGRLTEVSVGPYVTSIGALAFQNCISLSSVTLDPLTPPTLADGTVFDGNAVGRTFYVADYEDNSIMELYQGRGYWNEYADYIVEGDVPVVTNVLSVSNYAVDSSGSARFRGIAFNSSGELFAIDYNSITTDRVLGPIAEGDNLNSVSVYATGGSAKPSLLVFDNDDYLYEASDYTDTIYRVGPDGGAMSSWISPNIFIGGDRDPCWGGIAPEGFNGTNVGPGDLVIIDRDSPNNKSYIYSISPLDTAERSVLYSSNGEMVVDAVSGAFSSDTLYFTDAGKGLFAMDTDGNVTNISSLPSNCVAVHPVTGIVYFSSTGPSLMLRSYNPETGVIDIVGKIEAHISLGWRNMLFNSDGTSLFIPDGNYILEVTGF